MRIKRLHIGDFGILRNQTLQDLHPGMVVIGGLNRAGKSTFMQVLRYLGYGFPALGTLPPANIEYMVEADMTDEQSERTYHIRLNGQSQPICTPLGESDRIQASDLYKQDAFTYHNLFIISLDQLARIPAGVSKNELDKLQAVLLGAGLAGIANIPRLEEGFSKLAATIGGTTGRLTNKGFKPHVELIREGTKRKKNALGQVDAYHRQQNRLSDLKENENALQAELNQLRTERDLLEAVKGNYDLLEELAELDSLLEQHPGIEMPSHLSLENRSTVLAAYDNYVEQKARWKQEYDKLAVSLKQREHTGPVLDLLLQYRSQLQGFFDKLSGMEVRWDNLIDLRKRLQENRQQILGRMQRLHASWTEDDINWIQNLKLGLFDENKLMEAMSRLQTIEGQLSRIHFQLDDTQGKMEGLEKQREKWEKQTSISGLKAYFWVSTLSILLGLAVSFLHPTTGIFLGLFGIGGSALFAFYNGLGKKEAHIRLKEIQGELDSALIQQERLQQNRDEIGKEQNTVKQVLFDARDKLGLAQQVSLNSILEYYRALVDIKERIRGLGRDKAVQKEQSQLLAVQFDEIHSLLSQLEDPALEYESKELLNTEGWMEIQIGVKKWYSRMQTAVYLDSMDRDMKKTKERLLQLTGGNDDSLVEEQVHSYLALCEHRADYLQKESRRTVLQQSLERVVSSEGMKQALAGAQSAGFKKVFQDYPARESVDREYTQLNKKIQNQEDELQSCQEEVQKTNLSLEQLSLTGELEQAHIMIQKGRSGLYQKSYAYALHQTAAWLCKEIRNGFLDKMKDELLLKADHILHQLTSGGYQRIIPKDDLSDFSFALKDGTIQENSEVLSRGTREQVFLAVRLGRILESSPALPVMIDDSFVNFDSAHLKQAVAVINRLSQTHQVFLMTCHPHLVRMVMDTVADAQYWNLDHGRFTLTNGRGLIEALEAFQLSHSLL